ncbi:MAG: hypothetical protein KGI52_07110, partial [Burkholderiales bacterium]|nr:hypothetical protein [Burkholderiales bacterium]
MSINRNHWLKSALLSITLAAAISGCEAKTDAPATNGAAASANVFAGTYLFDARNTHSDFGKAHPQDAKRFGAAFNALLAGQVKKERTFISRITSG